MHTVSRRRFLQTSALAAAGLAARPGLFRSPLAHAFERTTRVVRTTDPGATSGWTVIDQEKVDRMVHFAIRALTGIPDTGEAWKSLFPGITTTKRVGLKINLSCGDVPTHPQVVNAIIDGLLLMDLGGGEHLAPEHIIVHDWDTAFFCAQTGYQVNYGGAGVQYFGTDHAGVGTDPAFNFPISHPHNSVTWHRPSRIITQMCDYLIDTSVIKDHSDAGVTLSLKNHYGSFDGIAVTQTHVSSYYGDGHARTEPELSRLLRDSLGNKQRLFLVDGTFGLYNGGPGYVPPYHTPPNWAFNSIIVGLDPVAVDRIGTVEINAKRATHGLPALDPSHVQAAAQPPYSLGTDDLAQIEYLQYDVAENSGLEPPPVAPGAPVLLSPYPNPMRDQCALRLICSSPVDASVLVFDVAGRVVRVLGQGRFGEGTHRLDWDGRDGRGDRVPGGSYFCRVRTNRSEMARRVVVIE